MTCGAFLRLSCLVHTQGLPAAFAHEAFGSFLDAKHSTPVTTSAATAVFRLVNILSHSYLPTDLDACKTAVAESLGADFIGEPRGQEAELMTEVRNALLEYLQAAMPEGTAFISLEPSASSYVSSDPSYAFRPRNACLLCHEACQIGFAAVSLVSICWH